MDSDARSNAPLLDSGFNCGLGSPTVTPINVMLQRPNLDEVFADLLVKHDRRPHTLKEALKQKGTPPGVIVVAESPVSGSARACAPTADPLKG